MPCVKMGYLWAAKKTNIYKSGRTAVSLFITGYNKETGFRKVKIGNIYCKFIENILAYQRM